MLNRVAPANVDWIYHVLVLAQFCALERPT
jgi:hypothetical protein